jgi:hypothetical protein
VRSLDEVVYVLIGDIIDDLDTTAAVGLAGLSQVILAPGSKLKIALTATGNFGIAHGERADVCLKNMEPIREQIAPAETR